MAFCIRNERKMDYLKKEISNPGPGQYFQQIEKNNIKKIIHPTFHTSGYRSTLIKKEEIPGSGSYDLLNKSFNKEISFNLNKNNQKGEETIKYNLKNNNSEKVFNNISTINKNNKSNVDYNTMNNYSSSNMGEISTIPFNDNSKININKNNSFSTLGNNNSDNINNINKSRQSVKLGFLSQATRFNDKEKSMTTNEPGPGTYEAIDYTNNIVLKNRKNKSRSKHNLIKASFKIEAGSLNRVISIPSKEMNGYLYVGDKNKNKK